MMNVRVNRREFLNWKRWKFDKGNFNTISIRYRDCGVTMWIVLRRCRFKVESLFDCLKKVKSFCRQGHLQYDNIAQHGAYDIY